VDWQLAAAYLAVTAALAYLGRRTWRAVRGARKCGGCGSGCGAARPPGKTNGPVVLIAAEELRLRRAGPEPPPRGAR
jgi:hypothetical protein